MTILEKNVTGRLITKAGDLPAFRDDADWKDEVEEVAALGT